MSTTTEANVYGTDNLNPEQAAIVAREVWFLFGMALEEKASIIDHLDVPTRDELDSAYDLITRYREALDLLEWGTPAGQVEFVATRSDLERVTACLMESGTDRLGAPKSYIGIGEFTDVQQVRDRGIAEISTARAITDQLEATR